MNKRAAKLESDILIGEIMEDCYSQHEYLEELALEIDVDWLLAEHAKTISKLEQFIRSQISGYVYLLRSDTGYWKIGQTVDPDNRLKTFGVKLPFKVEYEHLIPCRDHIQTEGEMHKHFADKLADVEYIKTICAI